MWARDVDFCVGVYIPMSFYTSARPSFTTCLCLQYISIMSCFLYQSSVHSTHTHKYMLTPLPFGLLTMVISKTSYLPCVVDSAILDPSLMHFTNPYNSVYSPEKGLWSFLDTDLWMAGAVYVDKLVR